MTADPPRDWPDLYPAAKVRANGDVYIRDHQAATHPLAGQVIGVVTTHPTWPVHAWISHDGAAGTAPNNQAALAELCDHAHNVEVDAWYEQHGRDVA